MESRSGRSSKQLRDYISALPDDLLLLILVRVCCVRTAASTGVLSRRWHNLWTLLPALTFRSYTGDKISSLQTALSRVVSPAVSKLKIHVPREKGGLHGEAITRLLSGPTRLKPKKLVVRLPEITIHGNVDLPCFYHTASIVLESWTHIRFQVPTGVEFATVETLSLSGLVVGLDTLIPHFPRLCVLRVDVSCCGDSMIVHSPSLQELYVDSTGWTPSFSITAPLLKKLATSLFLYDNVSISIQAPMLDKISWLSYYVTMAAIGFGRWSLLKVGLQMPEGRRQLASLHVHANILSFSPRNQTADITREIEKHLLVDFSSVELHLTTYGHVFGKFVFRLIGVNRISSAMKMLKVVLQGSKDKEGCPTICGCSPMNEKTNTITLHALEEMEIDGLRGEDHEFDFVAAVFKSAPMLKRVIVKMSLEFSSSGNELTKLYNIFKSYCFVDGFVYLSSGEYVQHE